MDFFKALPATATIRALLQAAADIIPIVDARLLLCHALQVSREWLAAHDDERPHAVQRELLASYFTRRANGEPVAYILGEREFYGRSLLVNQAVLIPRPETELLVELSLARLPGQAAARVLELGTGSGAIIISLKAERQGVDAHAVDLSEAALDVARRNAARHQVVVQFGLSNWFAQVSGRFELIVANPPYIALADPHLTQGDLRFEPALALSGGVDGLDAIRSIVRAAPNFLHHAGWLLLEHGYDQARAVRDLLAQAGFSAIAAERDLAGIARVTLGQWFHPAQFAS